jgi:hypothetical protein
MVELQYDQLQCFSRYLEALGQESKPTVGYQSSRFIAICSNWVFDISRLLFLDSPLEIARVLSAATMKQSQAERSVDSARIQFIFNQTPIE